MCNIEFSYSIDLLDRGRPTRVALSAMPSEG
jgi:hypothetical protein